MKKIILILAIPIILSLNNEQKEVFICKGKSSKKYHLDKKRYFYNYVKNSNSFMAYEIETNKMNRGYLLIRKLKDVAQSYISQQLHELNANVKLKIFTKIKKYFWRNPFF